MLTVEDNGGDQTTVEQHINVCATAKLDDPSRPGRQALFVGGTPEQDWIHFVQYRDAYVSVYLSSQKRWQSFDLENDERIYVYAGAGNDYVRMYYNVGFDAVIRGGEGNDRLYGGQGNDILLGGDGRDYLCGNGGRNMLIGGLGRDFLLGSTGDDILIGGVTSHDANDAALTAVMAEWTAAGTLEQRIDHLRGGGGLNGQFLLRMHETVFDDNEQDVFWGDAQNDWFLFYGSDHSLV